MEAEDKSAVGCTRTRVDLRHQPRFKMEADIRIRSRACGALKGRTVDISESGIAAMLPIETPVNEIVELSFTLRSEPMTILAIVRQRNAFRYGFEFVDSASLHGIIRRACRDLAVEQSILSPDLPANTSV
jgi:PilZ domain